MTSSNLILSIFINFLYFSSKLNDGSIHHFFFYHENGHLNVYVQGLQDGSAGKLSGHVPDGLSSRCGTSGKRRKLPEVVLWASHMSYSMQVSSLIAHAQTETFSEAGKIARWLREQAAVAKDGS